MSKTKINGDRMPSTWSQLYALAYGECSAMIESYLDDLIDRKELADLYRAQSTAHYDRVQALVRKLSEELLTGWPPE